MWQLATIASLVIITLHISCSFYFHDAVRILHPTIVYFDIGSDFDLVEVKSAESGPPNP